MPVQIQVKGDKETNEYKDALALKQIFEAEFANKDTNGEILIVSGATLFGQEVKDVDLIVLGNFDKYSSVIKSKAESGSFEERKELPIEKRLVFFNSFCFVIETKRQRAEDIQINGLQLLVRYNDRLHDVTSQSEKQKYSLTSYFKDRLNFTPYVCNFIWFKNVTWESLKQMLGSNESALTKHNYLPNTFSIAFLLQLACVQATPYNPTDNDGKLKGYSSFKCLKRNQRFDLKEMDSIFELFEKIKDGVGQLTRIKIEQITNKLLNNQQYAKAIGEKFIVISGRAGTGKTIKLLRIACDLANSRGARCLILTYNHALVSDIKRTLALAGIPDGVDTHTVSITTLHKLFFELLIGFGIVENKRNPGEEVKYIPDYLQKYDAYLKELYDYIDNGLIGEKDIQDLMVSRHDKVAWDFVLIDESQDWGEFEKAIIFKMFGKERVIIADGIDQLIRSSRKCNWTSGLKLDTDFKKTHEKRGLRQEVNLVSFIAAYAKELGITWELEPMPDLVGGKVIISTMDYSKEIHFKEIKRCKEFGNAEYEMMFLVPPRLVNVHKSDFGDIRSFKLKEEFEQMGINIWDSTSKDLRSQYVVDLKQHRLLQYESCRGLEGWTVVCLQLDEFIKYKMETFTEKSESGELALETFEEKRDKFVYLWSLIPLTRAIDTLVITLKDKNSRVGQALRKVYEQNPDYIQWID
jgi:hypothetical protein